jgi:hypothetical protein
MMHVVPVFSTHSRSRHGVLRSLFSGRWTLTSLSGFSLFISFSEIQGDKPPEEGIKRVVKGRVMPLYEDASQGYRVSTLTGP